MDRIFTDRFTNKKKMVISFIQKSVLVLALFVMMTGTAYAGAFLNDGGTAYTSGVDYLDNYSKNYVENRFRSGTDSWNSTQTGYSANDYEGYYIGTFGKKNDSKTILLDMIQYFMDNPNLSLLGYGKDDLNEFDIDDLKVTVSNNDGDSGDWDISEPTEQTTIDFYSVKGGTEFALYYIPDGGASSGTWTTAHVRNLGGKQPDISHFSVVKITDTPGNPQIPEPATMMLFGFSLIGLAGVARHRNGKF